MPTNLELRPTAAPSLPNATPEYIQQYEDQYSNVLRLYFNQLDNFTRAITASNGGSLITFPHIAASDSTDQIATGNNTPTLIKFNTLDSGSGWTLNAPGSATAISSGVYTIRYSLQFVNTDNAIHDATVWIRVNNIDLANSSTSFSIPAWGIYLSRCRPNRSLR